jgi:hypothetical protein
MASETGVNLVLNEYIIRSTHPVSYSQDYMRVHICAKKKSPFLHFHCLFLNGQATSFSASPVGVRCSPTSPYPVLLSVNMKLFKFFLGTMKRGQKSS